MEQLAIITISFKFPLCLQRFEFPLNEQILNPMDITPQQQYFYEFFLELM